MYFLSIFAIAAARIGAVDDAGLRPCAAFLIRNGLDMRLTSFTDYTLRVLIYLGLHREPGHLSTISEIAAAYGLSKNHLMKIVHHLAKQGYIETARGKGGGMRLARLPKRIRVGDVVRSTEEDFALTTCFQNESDDCPIVPVCRLRATLLHATHAFLEILDRTTLEDLLQPEEQLTEILRGRRAP